MTHDYITPLFWQHGEAEEVLREEIQRMKSVGIPELCRGAAAASGLFVRRLVAGCGYFG